MKDNKPAEINGEVIGLDVGAKRIGVARINSIAMLAEPLEPIIVSDSEPFSAVLTVVSEYSAVCVVIGLPRGLDGQETAQTQETLAFANKLKENSSLPIYLIDEAGTTKEAENRYVPGSKSSIDSLSACIILEDFINFADKSALELIK
jgi:putative Holliday junction resolvase